VEATDLAHRTVVHLASKRRTDEDIAAMQKAAHNFGQAIAQRDAIKMTEANRRFHATVALACHNPYLFAHYDRLLTLGLRMLRSRHLYQSFDSAGLEQQSREHYAIIAAIVAGDAALAEELAHNHTKEFVDRYVRSLQENLTGEISIRRAS
jgi:DNA-binding GntR family transcriptional regulator